MGTQFKKIRFPAIFERGYSEWLKSHLKSLEPIIDGRKLGIDVSVGEHQDMRNIWGRMLMIAASTGEIKDLSSSL